MSKQSKQYESMRQTQVNTFSDGLNMDLHPLTTPNTILTDCVNGTMITYNDNEFVLQNERGNTEIDGATLSDGFIPIGMKEHNGIIYIISHNSETNECEIGTFPSPAKLNSFKSANIGSDLIETDINFNYSEYVSEIKYYNYDLVISSFDKYEIELTNSDNPLLILEHYILTKNGKTWPVDLKTDGEEHRFKVSSEGILGYKYRPYYIDSLEANFVPTSLGSDSKLNIKFSSSDPKLIENFDKLDFECRIYVYLVNGKNSYKFKNYTLNIDDIKYTKSSILTGSCVKKFEVGDNSQKIKYDYEKGVFIDSWTKEEYADVKLVTELYISQEKEDVKFSMKMDNLSKSYETSAKSVFGSEKVFDEFFYFKNDTSNTLTIKASLNHKLLMDNITQNDIYDAYCTLYEIDNEGNIKKNISNTKQLSEASVRKFNVSSSDQNMNQYDLLSDIGTSYFFDYAGEKWELSKSDEQQCKKVDVKDATNVKYIKNDNTYNLQLWDGDVLLDSIEYDRNFNGCVVSDLFDERWTSVITSTNTHINYTFENIPYEKNKVYLMELSCGIKNNDYNFGFFVITTDKMLNNESKTKNLLTINDWFDSNITTTVSWSDGEINTNKTKYATNILPLNEISSENIKDLVYQFGLKFNDLMENPSPDDVPSFVHTMNYTITFEDTKTNFPIHVHSNLGNTEINQIINMKNWSLYKGKCEHKISLDVDNKETVKQTAEIEYLYKNLKDPKDLDLVLNGAFLYGVSIGNKQIIKSDYINISIGDQSNYKILRTLYADTDTAEDISYNWLDTSGNLKTYSSWIHRLRNGCYRDGATSKRTVTSFDKDDLKKSCLTLELLENYKWWGGVCFGEISSADNMTYSGKNKKAWIRGLNSEGKYVLVGMDIPDDNLDKARICWGILKQHMYYKKSVNKTITIFNYKKNVKEESSFKNTKTFNLCVYPILCEKLKGFNFNDLKIQSLNNIDISMVNTKEYQVDLSNYTQNSTYNQWYNNKDKYKNFLDNLSNFLTNFRIDINKLQWTSDDEDGIVYTDFNGQLFSTSGNGKNINDLKLNGVFFYNTDEKVLYKKITKATIENISYSGKSDCVEPLYWNYSSDYFINYDSIDLQDLQDYKSLLFYKFTNYLNNEQK